MELYRRKRIILGLGVFLTCVLSLSIGAGIANAALTCGSCHGMPPTDSSVRNPANGAFQGNHQTHTPVSAQASDCSRCHDVTGFTNSHRDGQININTNINASPATGEYRISGGTVFFKNQTSVPTLGTCANVNCHFERSTPVWGGPTLGARSDAVCSTCHDSVPTTNAHSTHTSLLATKSGGPAADTCITCHTTNYTDASHALQVGRPITVVLATGKYSTAMKTSYLPSQQSGRVAGDCSNLYCHSDGNGNYAKPNWGISSSGACGTCHAAPPTTLTHTTFGAAANTCSVCHIFTDASGVTHVNNTVDKQGFLLTEPHKNGKTLGSYSAAYITSQSTCADCHNANNTSNQTIRQEWAASSHANTGANAFRASDFKTQTSTSNCPRCHTTTGFVRFSSARAGGKWGVATDTTKEVITCRACHTEIATGTVRTMTPVKPFASYTAFQNADMGKSNVCADCHSGRDSGTRKLATLTNFSSTFSYSSHYLPAAGTVQGVTGYEFGGRTYAKLADNSHSKVGTLNANNTGTSGSCVTCHMSATDKHSFTPVTADLTGTITAIKTSICANCHSSSLPAATLEAKRVAFTNALSVLNAALADKGIVYDSTAKTFKRPNGMTIIKWGNVRMYGAAYNYRLFIAEPAAYAHNPEYARQIVTDSIDAAYNNGTLTGDITAAVADLLSRGKISQAQSDGLIPYTSATASCNNCHGYPPAGVNETSPFQPHAAATFGNLVNTCANCHVYTGSNGATHMNGTIDKLSFLITEPHKNGKTLGMYSAAYITSRSTCADCHNTNSDNQAIRQQWAASGHANTGSLPWIDYDFKTRSTCVRCHTTTGFVAYSSANMVAAWGTASDTGTKEVLTCRGCHSDSATGTVRTVKPNKPYTNDQTFTNADVGKSNICMDCHGGRDTGNAAIALILKPYSSASSYATHYLPAGGTLQGKVGYNYRSTYPALADNSHGKIGTLDANGTGTNGPCVTCHMSATDKHSFTPVTRDGSGTITAIKTNICANCHNSSLPAATLDAKRLAFKDALEILRIALADKGYIWTPATDNFNSGYKGINWGTTAQGGKDIMGAAHNYKLFVKEPGAYAHNPEYARQLIIDSIIAVYNKGTLVNFAAINTDIELAAALAYLQGKGLITQGQTDKLIGYKNPDNSCTTCHGNPPGSETHTGIVAGTCANCHIFTGVSGATHNNGTVDLNLDVASCNSCHGYPPAPRVTETQLTFGVQGQWSSARFEDYSGGGGAHLVAGHLLASVKPSDGWTPCLTCHSGGASSHTRKLPLRNHIENVTVSIDQKYRFNEGLLPVYTTAKLTSGGNNQSGSCFNVSCHFKPSPKWSLER